MSKAMRFVSTRGKEKVTGAEAIVKGWASDGGLFVPESFPQVTAEELSQMGGMNYAERAAFILEKYFGAELGEDFLLDVCNKAYAKFAGDDPVPVVKVDDGLFILELFHGPSCSFKDVSMTLMPELLKKSCEKLGVEEEFLLLLATSGDTGKATMESFRDVPGVKVAVCYPDEGTAKMQRLGMSIQDGNNLLSAAVAGNYDDCRRAVNKLYTDESFHAKLQEKGVRLLNMSSVNVARILPQIAYYFSAYVDLLTSGKADEGEQIDFVVSAGNFGNILAGWYAKQMGLPVRKLVCASNKNKALADFFATGKYDVKRNFHHTMSPSMDVLAPTNLERLLFEVSGKNAKLTAERMKALDSSGEYSITQEEKAKLDADFYSGFASEDDTVEAMYDIFEEYGYAMDTHTGVALAVFANYLEVKDRKDVTQSVVLATANPYKFPQDVLYALTGNDVKDSFKGVKRLNLLTAMKAPKCLLALRYRPLRFKKVYPNDPKKLAAVVLDFVDGNIIPVPDEGKK